MLRTIRLTTAIVCFTLITLLFLVSTALLFVRWECFRTLFRGYPANKRKTGSVIHQQ